MICTRVPAYPVHHRCLGLDPSALLWQSAPNPVLNGIERWVFGAKDERVRASISGDLRDMPGLER